MKDPVAAAQVVAARELKLTAFDGSRVTRPDWRREKEPEAPLDNCHYVTLRTPWRKGD